MIDYFDTSAIAKRYVKEPGSPEVRRALARGHSAVARITYAELDLSALEDGVRGTGTWHEDEDEDALSWTVTKDANDRRGASS